MARRDIKQGLRSSLKKEEAVVKERIKSKFDRADAALGGRRQPEEGKPRGNGGKVVRDSFTMPDSDHKLIERIKVRVMKAGVGTNKSEVLRAGLAVLDKMADRELIKVFEKLPKVKPGRPATKEG